MPHRTFPTWRIMCHVMLGAVDHLPHHLHTIEEIRRYQHERLGRLFGESLLVELMPLPSPTLNNWWYSAIPEIDKRYPDRLSHESVWSDRKKLLSNCIEKGAPPLIICYGKGGWEKFKSLFPLEAWQSDDVFLIGFDGRRSIILTPHFAARSMNRKVERLEELAAAQLAQL